MMLRSRPALLRRLYLKGAGRKYHVLAIETSCDDTTVALIDRPPAPQPPVLLDHYKRSLDNTAAGGIIPIDARNFHQRNLALMVQEVLQRNGMSHGLTPQDVVAVTRGPGMMGSLGAGFNLAKGLSVAWGCGFVGVHHMVGHLLTPRLFADESGRTPEYPFVSLLVSGGHTMLVLSTSVTEHKVLTNTIDIAIGDMLDKCARELGMRGSMLGMELERFINEQQQLQQQQIKAGIEPQPHNVPDEFVMPTPLRGKGARKATTAYSFAAFISALQIERRKHFPDISTLADLPAPTRLELAKRVQTGIFNHLAKQTALALEAADLPSDKLDFVCAGGVASNQHLRTVLAEKLESKGFSGMRRFYPAPKWCTDNAAMIGWAGIELWEAGLQTDLAAMPTSRWSVEDMLSLGGWLKRE